MSAMLNSGGGGGEESKYFPEDLRFYTYLKVQKCLLPKFHCPPPPPLPWLPGCIIPPGLKYLNSTGLMSVKKEKLKFLDTVYVYLNVLCEYVCLLINPYYYMDSISCPMHCSFQSHRALLCLNAPVPTIYFLAKGLRFVYSMYILIILQSNV